MTEPREHPIIFSGPMILAILEGRKTQTRRVIPLASRWQAEYGDKLIPESRLLECCPFGQAGDRLWVRETICKHPHGNFPGGTYAADCTPVIGDKAYCERALWWYRRDVCPSIHMPRWACRIELEVTDVQVKRLQDMLARDYLAEGYAAPNIDKIIDDKALDIVRSLPESKRSLALTIAPTKPERPPSPRQWFSALWDSLNEKRGFGWATNPWVWALTFRRLPCPS